MKTIKTLVFVIILLSVFSACKKKEYCYTCEKMKISGTVVQTSNACNEDKLKAESNAFLKLKNDSDTVIQCHEN